MIDKNIGFIGLGNVGSKLANSILLGGYNLFIYDMNGKLILQETINGKSNKVIDVSTYSTGVYLLHIVDKYHQTIKVFKIQKQH